MENRNSIFKSLNVDKALLLLSVFSFCYWITGKQINIYQYKLVGVIFEMLWLPMLLVLFTIPLLAFYFWKKEKFVLKSLHFLTLLISVLFIFTVLFLNKFKV
jgi:hypothetical protein